MSGINSQLKLRFARTIGVAFAVLAISLSGCYGTESQAECQPNIGLTVVRIDDKNERLFLEITQDDASDTEVVEELLQQAKLFVETCKVGWSEDWAVSLFSDAARAGYKDDADILKYVKDGSWEKSYLGEYDNRSHTLILYPMDQLNRFEKNLEIQ